jgi:tRNA-Thr(GGU) m(6)t(6)A37 methyltransferase TsaA
VSIKQVQFRPIGVVQTPVTDDEIRGREGDYDSQVEVYPEFAPGLEGIDGFSHVFILAYLHRLRPEQTGPLQVKPRRLLRKGLTLDELPLLGVFALDSPTRPNPIGLSLVELRRRDGRILTVRGLDYFAGTPVLDIKPYLTEYRAEAVRFPRWYADLMARVGSF